MSDSAYDLDRFDELIALGFHGAMSDEDHAELESILRTSRDARRAYADWMAEAAVLRRWANAQAQPSAIESATTAPVPLVATGMTTGARAWSRGYAVAAAVALAAVAWVIYVVSINRSQTGAGDARSGAPVATLIDSTAAVYVNDGPANPGDDYERGSYAIDAGEADLLLRSQVAVKLVGHTRLTLHSTMEATLERGSATFSCPRGAVGFTVYLPDRTKIVDLGTDFRIKVDDDGATLRVTKGRVEWFHGERSEVVEAGHALRIAGDRVERPIALGPRRMPTFAGPLRDGDFDFDHAPAPDERFIGIEQLSDAWVITSDKLRVGWYLGGDDIEAHSPPAYARFTGGETVGAGIMQAISTEPGVEYELTFFAAKLGAVDGLKLDVDLYDGVATSDEPGDVYHERIHLNWPRRTWKEFRVRFTARSAVTSLRFTEPVTSKTLIGAPAIDTIRLTALPGSHSPSPRGDIPANPCSEGTQNDAD